MVVYVCCSGAGNGSDVCFVIGYLLLGDEEYLEMFEPLYVAVNKRLKDNDWYMDANMDSGARSLPWFTALSGFWPGLQVLYGDIAAAQRTMLDFQQIWRRLAQASTLHALH